MYWALFLFFVNSIIACIGLCKSSFPVPDTMNPRVQWFQESIHASVRRMLVVSELFLADTTMNRRSGRSGQFTGTTTMWFLGWWLCTWLLFLISFGTSCTVVRWGPLRPRRCHPVGGTEDGFRCGG